MAATEGEDVVASYLADIHYYFNHPASVPLHHRFDKGSFIYIYENANLGRSRIEVANSPGTRSQDAFDGYLDDVRVEYAHEQSCVVTLITNQEATSHIHHGDDGWHLPSYDLGHMFKQQCRMHSMDIYFYVKEDALLFLNAIRRVLPERQLHIVDSPRLAQASFEPVSDVVRELEGIAVKDNRHHSGKVQEEASSSDTFDSRGSLPNVSIGAYNDHGNRPLLPGSPPPPNPSPQATSQPQHPQPPPLAYNPASPAPPEPISHREKTPPPSPDETSPSNPLKHLVTDSSDLSKPHFDYLLNDAPYSPFTTGVYFSGPPIVTNSRYANPPPPPSTSTTIGSREMGGMKEAIEGRVRSAIFGAEDGRSMPRYVPSGDIPSTVEYSNPPIAASIEAVSSGLSSPNSTDLLGYNLTTSASMRQSQLPVQTHSHTRSDNLAFPPTHHSPECIIPSNPAHPSTSPFPNPASSPIPEETDEYAIHQHLYIPDNHEEQKKFPAKKQAVIAGKGGEAGRSAGNRKLEGRAERAEKGVNGFLKRLERRIG